MNKSFIAVFALCAPLSCQAYEYFLDPLFSASERYNTNINMLPNPPQDNWITAISPGFNFGFRNEKEKFNSNYTLNHLAYTNQSALDFDEHLLGADYQIDTSERVHLGLAGGYNIRSSLNTENTILGDVRFTQASTEMINLGTSASYDLDELNTMSFQYSYNKTTYDQSQTSNNIFRTDYDYHQASLSLRHIYSERDLLNFTLSSSLYQTSATRQETTTYNHIAQVGWQHSFDDQLTGSISAGLNYADTEAVDQIPAHCLLIPTNVNSPCFPFRFVPASQVSTTNTGVGEIFSISVQKSFERGSVSFIASQNQSPTSQGLQTNTMLSINSDYKISDRWSSGIVARYSTSESAAGQNSQNSRFNRTNYSFSPNISWDWTPEIGLGLSYTYRQQEFEGRQAAEGNIVQLQFSYRPQINNLVK